MNFFIHTKRDTVEVHRDGQPPLAVTADEACRMLLTHGGLLAEAEVFLAVCESMPAPQLGDWNWPDMRDRLAALLARAKGGTP